MAGLGQLVRSLSEIVPVRTLLVVLFVVGILALPSWFETVRDRQLRGAVRRMVRADPETRAALVDRAITLAAHVPRRLSVLAGEAIRYDQRDVRDRALAALEQTGADTRALRERIERPKVRFRDPVEAIVRIEALLSEGLVEAAREQIADARSTFPDDPDLASLETKLRG